ncbi:MAG: VWA domain-containing protein [Candidatus Marinimicrobia bacterium]|nr:VWA domain-containing protein [Candidatus Neomarinimicrobiota bacterium]
METRIWDGIDNSQDKSNSGYGNISLAPAIRNSGGVDKTDNVVLIDISGSTQDATSSNDSTPKLIREKEVTTMFISKLPPCAKFSLISFGEPARVEIPLQPLNQKLNAIQKVQQLDYNGATGMRHALTLARKELQGSYTNYFRRVYCITDGMGTDGDCTKIANRLKAENIQLHFIGFGSGNEIDEATMRNLASTSEDGRILYMHFTEFSQLSRYMGTQSQTITY